MKEFHGGCHCGNIRYVLLWPEGENAPLRKCNCSFCVRHGAAYTSHPNASLEVTVSDPKAFNEYRFATRTAGFRLCARCGVLTFVTSLIDGREHGVINVNTLESSLPAADVGTKDFESETGEERLARRRRTWIRDLSVTFGGA